VLSNGHQSREVMGVRHDQRAVVLIFSVIIIGWPQVRENWEQMGLVFRLVSESLCVSSGSV